MSAKTVTVDAAALRKFLRLPADATHEQVEAELAKPAPTKSRRKSSRSRSRKADATQQAYYREHFPELRDRR